MPRNNPPNDANRVNRNNSPLGFLQPQNQQRIAPAQQRVAPVRRVQYVPPPPQIPEILMMHRPILDSDDFIDFTQERPNEFRNYVQEITSLFAPNASPEGRNEYLRAMYNVDNYHIIYRQAILGLIDQLYHISYLHPNDEAIQLAAELAENFALQYLPENIFD